MAKNRTIRVTDSHHLSSAIAVWTCGVQTLSCRVSFPAGQNNRFIRMDYCRLKLCCRYFDRLRCRSIEREKGRVMVMIYRSGGVQLGPPLSLNSLSDQICAAGVREIHPAGQQLLLAIFARHYISLLARICFDATLRPDTTICDR